MYSFGYKITWFFLILKVALYFLGVLLKCATTFVLTNIPSRNGVYIRYVDDSPRFGSPKLRISDIPSSGLTTFLLDTAKIWLYTSVVVELLWPRSTWIIRKLVPCCNKWVAKLCLRVCTVAQGFIPLFSTDFLNTFWMLFVEYCPPSCPSNSQ